MRLWPGTLLFRKDVYKQLVNHYGIVVQESPCVIAHIDKTQEGFLNPKIELYETFAAGIHVTAEPSAAPVPVDELWNRLESVRQTKRPYGLMAWGDAWNCESFARFVRDGIARSTQAEVATRVLTVAGIFVLLKWLASSGDQKPEVTTPAAEVVKCDRFVAASAVPEKKNSAA